MKKILIPKSNLKISRIGLGGLHFGSFISPSESKKIIHKCLSGGINFIETAAMYGNKQSSKIIGRALQKKRSNIILSYKVGLEPKYLGNLFKCEIAKLDKDYINQKLNEGLLNLKTDWIDIFQIHGFDYKTNLIDLLDTIYDLIKIGKVRYFGFSNIEKKQLIDVLKTKHPVLKKLILIQLQFNILERKAEKRFFNYCKKKNLSIFFNQVFAKGILLNKYSKNRELPKKSRASLSFSLRNQLNNKILRFSNNLDIIAKSMDIELNNMILSWTMSKFDNSISILGFSKEEQVINYNRTHLYKDCKEIDYKIGKLIKKNLYHKTIYDKPKKFINL